jgi:hypothetical protein
MTIEEKLNHFLIWYNDIYVPYKLIPKIKNTCLGGYDERAYPYPNIKSFDDYLKTKKKH